MVEITWVIEAFQIGWTTRCGVLLKHPGEHSRERRFTTADPYILQAGYAKSAGTKRTLSGAPQGGVCSQQYLDKLDKLQPKLLLIQSGNAGRKTYPINLSGAHSYTRAKRDRRAVRACVGNEAEIVPCKVIRPTYRRLRYENIPMIGRWFQCGRSWGGDQAGHQNVSWETEVELSEEERL